jgi:hypothetical protein
LEVQVFVQECSGVGSNAEKESMSEIDLAGIARDEVPTDGKDNKDVGEDEGAQDIGVFGE